LSRRLGQVFFEPRRQRQLLLLLGGSVLAAFMEMAAISAVPLFVSYVVDPVRTLDLLPGSRLAVSLQRTSFPTLTVLGAAAMALLFLAKNIYVAALYAAEGRVMRSIHVATSERLFRAYLEAPYALHLQRNPAELTRNVEAEVARSLVFVNSSMRLVREALVLAVIAAIIMLVDPAVSASVFLLMAAASALFYVSIRHVLGRRALEAQANRGRQLQAISQGIGSVKEARVLGRLDYLIERFVQETRAIGEHERYFRLMGELPRLFLEFVAITAVLIVAVMFVFLDRQPESMLPVLALLAAAGARMVPAFNIITSSLARIRYEWPSFVLVATELQSLEATAARRTSAPVSAEKLQASLDLKDVHYRYAGATEDALRGVTLQVRRGEVVGIIGPSGSGKSTLIDVILGVLEPTGGTVYVDGRDVREDLATWQHQIGYVPQDIYLLDDTIIRNVAFGIPDEEIDTTAVERALRAAQLGDFVRSANRLDTVVGNRGVRLSGGQRQRLGVARALYHDPAVLVMDEATSALDNETERSLVDAIQSLRGVHTIVIVAHRLSTIRGCDRLYLLDQGRVADTGTFDALMSRHEQLRGRTVFAAERMTSPVG
jgi:ATP-binding cassette, subfamily B, bacterial PglK